VQVTLVEEEDTTLSHSFFPSLSHVAAAAGRREGDAPEAPNLNRVPPEEIPKAFLKNTEEWVAEGEKPYSGLAPTIVGGF
jgi:hypothetical protein